MRAIEQRVSERPDPTNYATNNTSPSHQAQPQTQTQSQQQQQQFSNVQPQQQQVVVPVSAKFFVELPLEKTPGRRGTSNSTFMAKKDHTKHWLLTENRSQHWFELQIEMICVLVKQSFRHMGPKLRAGVQVNTTETN
uniref:Uncharacterized protein n=1 Tax=Glossina pallidipes TaxID=7398 RepID=A0A1B0A049_GLOPL